MIILHKNYKFCPECQSVMIRKIHRNWIQKYILLQKPRYKCGNCLAIFAKPLDEESLGKIGIEKNTETTYKDRPTISPDEIHAINLEIKKKQDRDEAYEKAFQAAYEKGFKDGLNKGI